MIDIYAPTTARGQRYRGDAFWYACGRQDAGESGRDSEGAWDFANYVAQRADDYEHERVSYLPSIQAMFDEWRNR